MLFKRELISLVLEQIPEYDDGELEDSEDERKLEEEINQYRDETTGVW